MITVESTLQAAGMLAWAIILAHSIGAINRMSWDTRHGVRVAFLLLATGGLAQIIDPWVSRELASDADLMLGLGLALLLLFDKRCISCAYAEAVLERRRRRDAISVLRHFYEERILGRRAATYPPRQGPNRSEPADGS